MQWYWFTASVCDMTRSSGVLQILSPGNTDTRLEFFPMHTRPHRLHATAPRIVLAIHASQKAYRHGCDDHIQTHTRIVFPITCLVITYKPIHIRLMSIHRTRDQLYNVLHQGSKTSLYCMQRQSASEQLLPNTECTTGEQGKKIPLFSIPYPLVNATISV